MNNRHFLAGTIGVLLVGLFSLIARLTFLDGSLFDPAAAPGIGPFALGDLLVIGAFIAGYALSYISQHNEQSGRR